jgi:hypothetical protein
VFILLSFLRPTRFHSVLGNLGHLGPPPGFLLNFLRMFDTQGKTRASHREALVRTYIEYRL